MKNDRIISLALFMLALMLATACSEEDEPAPIEENDPGTEVPPDVEEPSEDLFYQKIRIENLGTGSDNSAGENPTAPKTAFYFSLEDSTVRSDLYIKTNRWDLSFGGILNSFLSSNNGANPKNPGYGANGVGGICILKENFDNVIDIPPPEMFETGGNEIGTDPSGAFGELGLGTGWYLYDFGGNIRGDGSYEKRHVAYALQDTRTIVVRTARGNYAKIKMISVYKDAFTPEEWFRDTPHMYFTFEYVLVPASSKKFEIRS